MPTYYAILGLDPRKFDPVHLKKQYRALALRWHPDRNRGNEEAAAEKFKELQKAFEVLSDEALRRSYDRELMVRRARGFDSVTPRGKATPRSQPPPPPPPPPKDEQSRKIVNDALRSDEWLHEVNRRAKLAADKQEEEEIDEALKAVEEAIQRGRSSHSPDFMLMFVCHSAFPTHPFNACCRLCRNKRRRSPRSTPSPPLRPPLRYRRTATRLSCPSAAQWLMSMGVDWDESLSLAT